MRIPNHIGFILDGNRRFANKVNLLRLEAHRQGAEKIRSVLNWCKEIGVKYTTLWAFSTENFNRSDDELKEIFNLIIEYCKKFIDDPEVHDSKVKLSIIGDVDRFPEEVQNAVNRAVEASKDYDGFFLNMALAYGGKNEILSGVKKIAKLVESRELKSQDITEEIVEDHLHSSHVPNVDLIIRTSGEQRTSGFLMWKSDYAEYYFSEKYWPEFDKEELIKAIISYNDRKRRYGL